MTMAPATESVMGSLPREKAGVGSAINDTTRQVGGALGVAIIGSVVSSVYGSKIASAASGASGSTPSRPASPSRRSAPPSASAASLGDQGAAFVERRQRRVRRCAVDRPADLGLGRHRSRRIVAWRFLPSHAREATHARHPAGRPGRRTRLHDSATSSTSTAQTGRFVTRPARRARSPASWTAAGADRRVRRSDR